MPVPAEHLGRARQLRRNLAASGKASQDAVDSMLAPLRAGIAKRGHMRAEEIAAAMRAWRLTMPPTNRVCLSIQRAGRSVLIDETMLLASELSRPHFRLGDWEPGLCLSGMQVRLAPRKAEMSERDLIALSLHAIGRRFERGASPADRSNEAVLYDLGALAAHHPDFMPAGGFTIPAPTGRWVGERVAIDGKPVALIRSFFHADMP